MTHDDQRQRVRDSLDYEGHCNVYRRRIDVVTPKLQKDEPEDQWLGAMRDEIGVTTGSDPEIAW